MDCVRFDPDGHLEEAYEDRQNSGLDETAAEESDVDPELEAWLRAREADLAEQAFALSDQFSGEEWR